MQAICTPTAWQCPPGRISAAPAARQVADPEQRCGPVPGDRIAELMTPKVAAQWRTDVDIAYLVASVDGVGSMVSSREVGPFYVKFPSRRS